MSGTGHDAAAAVAALADALLARGWRLATAESCTGGLIAAACTDRAGSSDWFERGFVTYSNAAKSEALGVEPGSAHHALQAEITSSAHRAATRSSSRMPKPARHPKP